MSQQEAQLINGNSAIEITKTANDETASENINVDKLTVELGTKTTLKPAVKVSKVFKLSCNNNLL